VFSTWSYETDQPLALEALRETMRELPGIVYPAKGVVYTIDAPQRRAVLQVVGRVSVTGRALVQRPSWASDRSYYSESQYTKWLRFESGASRCARS
jgi:Cobalamin synthesis protein cobW C-terminal domain